MVGNFQRHFKDGSRRVKETLTNQMDYRSPNVLQDYIRDKERRAKGEISTKRDDAWQSLIIMDGISQKSYITDEDVIRAINAADPINIYLKRNQSVLAMNNDRYQAIAGEFTRLGYQWLRERTGLALNTDQRWGFRPLQDLSAYNTEEGNTTNHALRVRVIEASREFLESAYCDLCSASRSFDLTSRSWRRGIQDPYTPYEQPESTSQEATDYLEGVKSLNEGGRVDEYNLTHPRDLSPLPEHLKPPKSHLQSWDHPYSDLTKAERPQFFDAEDECNPENRIYKHPPSNTDHTNHIDENVRQKRVITLNQIHNLLRTYYPLRSRIRELNDGTHSRHKKELEECEEAHEKLLRIARDVVRDPNSENFIPSDVLQELQEISGLERRRKLRRRQK